MQKLFKRGALILFFLGTALGCSSWKSSDPLDYPLTSIYSAIEKAMSMGIQKYSVNHREFYSRPFLIKQNEALLKSGLRERGVAKVFVLGDGRPYTIEVEVSIEVNSHKDSNEYSFTRKDKRLANKLLTSILNILDQREYNKNAIDDFRSF